MQECLWLVKNGTPWDVAFGVDEKLRMAMSISFSQMEGRVYNWNSMRFEEMK